MHLREYIRTHGDEAAARLFEVKVRTAASWRRGERKPRHAQADRIIIVMLGCMTYADIYGPEPSESSP